MKLAGQGGYAMAALLVGMSVMAVLLGALLPQWTTLATREKEQELVFRGNQYARAIGLFQRKFANTAPPTIDVLVEQRFLRKKYKDPITNDDFQPIYASLAPQGPNTPAGANRPGQQASARPGPPAQQTPQPGSGNAGATSGVGIIGVTSKSTETSLKLYNGRDKYNEWAFVYVQTAQRPQGPGQGVQPGAGGPQGPGQQPGQQQRPGGPGGSPSSPFSPGASQPNRPPIPGQPRPPGN
ncbi:MAG: type II secretion system protein [Acidobacteria bacterium]|nr:type II secretion system protein [Acidobacteriota bacterium]